MIKTLFSRGNFLRELIKGSFNLPLGSMGGLFSLYFFLERQQRKQMSRETFGRTHFDPCRNAPVSRAGLTHFFHLKPRHHFCPSNKMNGSAATEYQFYIYIYMYVGAPPKILPPSGRRKLLQRKQSSGGAADAESFSLPIYYKHTLRWWTGSAWKKLIKRDN